MDREKVISQVEEEVRLGKHWDESDRTIDMALLENVLLLLKEQEPVPVTQREVMHMLVWCCGSCGVAITDGDKFCRMCGRRMKWK